MSKTTIAIGYSGLPIMLWAEYNKKTGRIWVINGLWEGTFKDNVLTVLHTEESFKCEILWSGKVPDHYSDKNYNAAMDWIDKEIKRKYEL